MVNTALINVIFGLMSNYGGGVISNSLLPSKVGPFPSLEKAHGMVGYI